MSSSTFYLTLVGFAAVTFLVYKLVLKADGGDRPAAPGERRASAAPYSAPQPPARSSSCSGCGGSTATVRMRNALGIGLAIGLAIGLGIGCSG